MSTPISNTRLFLLLLCAVVLGGVLQWQIGSRIIRPAQVEAPAKPTNLVDLEAMQKDVERLKSITTSASVAMADVGFHFSNLWFAGQKQNWPLATYYYNESRNHIRWLVRITPMPKGPDGELVDLQGIFDGIDTSALKDLKDVIDKKDAPRFTAAYRKTLEACYSCHKAVGRPYLRTAVPTAPPQSIVGLDPAATWPQ
ncbi:MAG: hypothetical protein AB7I50_25015 [Vicinamibacterales bacterium]